VCECPANATTGVLFTATNAVKFPSVVARSSWALPLSYYRANTFISCRISKLKLNKLSATVVKNQLFRLLWHSFPYLRLKLDCLESNSIVTRELIPLFYVNQIKNTLVLEKRKANQKQQSKWLDVATRFDMKLRPRILFGSIINSCFKILVY